MGKNTVEPETPAGQEEAVASEFRAAPLEAAAPEAAARAPEAPAVDEFHGKGGSYVVDPKTGKRQLVERTGWKANEAHDGEVGGDGTAQA